MTELEREIDKTKNEISGLERALLEKRSYLSGLEKAMKFQSKALNQYTLRIGGDPQKAHEAIRAAGHPLHVDKILTCIGKEATSQNKTSLTGSLAAYVRKNTIFTRPAPNTFGLLEFDSAPAEVETGTM